MLRKYPALLEKVCQDIDAFPHLLERIGEILQEDGMMSLTALTTIRRDAEGVYYRVRRELSHMHRHEQKSVLEYMERLKGYEALQNIATQLQEQRNSLKLILVLIPRYICIRSTPAFPDYQGGTVFEIGGEKPRLDLLT